MRTQTSNDYSTVARAALCAVTASLLAGGCIGVDRDRDDVGKSVLNLGEDNGIKLNGIKLNGIKLNGIKLNGIKLNGIKLNGIKLNGIKLNGIDPEVGNIRLGIDARELNPGLSDADACNLARHIVWYAFAEDDYRGVICVIDGEAQLLKEEGGLGVYANLGADNQSAADIQLGVQALMDTICGAAFNNVPRGVSWRGYRGPPFNDVIPTTNDELDMYAHREGVFWAAIDANGDFSCNFASGDDDFGQAMFGHVIKRHCSDNACPWFVYHDKPDAASDMLGERHCSDVDAVNGHSGCRDQANDYLGAGMQAGGPSGGPGSPGGDDGMGGGTGMQLVGNAVGGRGVWLDVDQTCEYFATCGLDEQGL